MIDIRESVPLSEYTTFKTGGVARFMMTVSNRAELVEALAFAAEQGLTYVIIAGGSNVLVADEGVPGLVIKLELTGREYAAGAGDTVLLTAGAGEVLDAIIAETVEKGYWGLENLSAIPGSVGAVPVQNVGAYGVEAGDVISSVEVLDTKSGSVRTLLPEECGFSYRDSLFKREAGKNLIVTAVTFALSTRPDPRLGYKDLAAAFAGRAPTQSEIREAVIAIRSKKFPDWRVVGTAGSFFKNPIISREQLQTLAARYPELPYYEVNENEVKLPLGWILDKLCNLKGYREGNVGCYDGQALVIVNYGGARTSEIAAFAKKIMAMVRELTGIDIEWEVTPVPTIEKEREAE